MAKETVAVTLAMHGHRRLCFMKAWTSVSGARIPPGILQTPAEERAQGCVYFPLSSDLRLSAR